MSARVFQPSLAGGEISPALYGRVDIDKYAISLRRCRNFIPHRTGGVSNRPGLEFLGEVQDSAVLPALVEFRFNNTTQTCLLEFGEKTMRVWFQGALVMTADGTPLVVATPYTALEARDLSHVQSADVLYLAQRTHPPRKLVRRSWTDWAFAVVNFQPGQAPPSATAFGAGGDIAVGGGDAIAYKVTAVHPDTGEESLPCAKIIEVTGPTVGSWTVNQKITLTLGDGAAYANSGVIFKFYKAVTTRVFGYIGEATHGTGPTATLIDRNITPDIARQPPDGTNPFDGAGNYPSLVALHQQRLVFGATDARPNGLWFSRTGFYENMSRSAPPRDDDSITVVIGSGEVNEIRGLVSIQDLVTLTSGSENVINGGQTGSVITPSSISIRPQSYWGSGRREPLVTGNTILFLQGIGCAVRDLGYDYAVDGFSGNDRTILSRHLLEGHEITAWDYAQTPDSVFWMVRSDGALLSLSYFREQEIGAWALHTTDGAFESVRVMEGSDRHEVYVIVRRTVQGKPRRYLERFASRRVRTITDARFLDSHLCYQGPPTQTVSGLDHLEGRKVDALVDGSPVYDLVVKGGQVTFGRAYGSIVVGLRYHDRSHIATLPIDMGMVQGMGSVIGRKKTVTGLTLMVEASREFVAGPWEDATGDDLAARKAKGQVTLVKTTPLTHDAPVEVASGSLRLKIPSTWTSHGSVTIAPDGPLPLTVLAIAPDIDIGDM